MKKTIEYYLSLPYRLEIVPDTEEGGYGARYPELPGCITCADTLEGVVAMSVPEPDSDENYSGQFKLRMPRSLHRSLSVHAKQEGISMNQYCLYLLTKNDAAHTAHAVAL